MAKQFTRGRGRLGSKRLTSWVGFTLAQVTVDGSANLVQSFNAALLAVRSFTIVRTHFSYYYVSDQAAVTEGYSGAVGLAVVSDQAVAVGVTAVPTPVDDIGSDLFLLHSIFHGGFGFLSSVGFDSVRGVQVDVDSKAMRRVNDDQDMVVVFESTTVGDGVQIISMGRMLIKES